VVFLVFFFLAFLPCLAVALALALEEVEDNDVCPGVPAEGSDAALTAGAAIAALRIPANKICLIMRINLRVVRPMRN